MKFAPLRALIAVSLVANVVLAVILASRFADGWASERHARERANSGQSATSPKAEFVRLPPDTWTQLAAGYERLFAPRLLAAGFPRDVARAMVSARVCEQLA